MEHEIQAVVLPEQGLVVLREVTASGPDIGEVWAMVSVQSAARSAED